MAGLIAMRPGSRTRLCHRLRTHPAGKGKRRSMGERDFIALVDGVHQLVKAPIVLVWDRLNTHVSHAMRELITERDWLTVFLLPAYSPDLNPVEWVWAHVSAVWLTSPWSLSTGSKPSYATGSNASSTAPKPSTAS
ncbi:transposase [Streptomyces diastatochromogenes]|nr:transposase [Streptomyces diastatochromogenes]MCZ0985987.1 transposase [Streptomyces diastatochromogenes]